MLGVCGKARQNLQIRSSGRSINIDDEVSTEEPKDIMVGTQGRHAQYAESMMASPCARRFVFAEWLRSRWIDRTSGE